jgi:hypothetical protein
MWSLNIPLEEWRVVWGRLPWLVFHEFLLPVSLWLEHRISTFTSTHQQSKDMLSELFAGEDFVLLLKFKDIMDNMKYKGWESMCGYKGLKESMTRVQNIH